MQHNTKRPFRCVRILNTFVPLEKSASPGDLLNDRRQPSFEGPGGLQKVIATSSLDEIISFREGGGKFIETDRVPEGIEELIGIPRRRRCS